MIQNWNRSNAKSGSRSGLIHPDVDLDTSQHQDQRFPKCRDHFTFTTQQHRTTASSLTKPKWVFRPQLVPNHRWGHNRKKHLLLLFQISQLSFKITPQQVKTPPKMLLQKTSSPFSCAQPRFRFSREGAWHGCKQTPNMFSLFELAKIITFQGSDFSKTKSGNHILHHAWKEVGERSILALLFSNGECNF